MMHAESIQRRRFATNSVRQTVEFVVCLLITVLLSRTWFIESFVVPSSSMAPSLLGIHREVRCVDCGHQFVCGTDDLTGQSLTAVCINCGCAENDATQLPDVNGDRLVVYKSAYNIRPPQRWEVVVFRYPEIARKAFIKRVVGLPGEEVQVVDGDLHIDGQLVRKSLAEQRALAVLVHDSTATSSFLPPRWNADQPHTGWRFGGGRFFRGAAEDRITDWLTYRHWRRAPGTPRQVEETTILDHNAYNQSRTQKIEDANLVADLLLSARLRTRHPGRLSFFLANARDQMLLHVEPHSGHIELWHNGREVATAQAAPNLFFQDTTVEVSTIDRQFLVAFDGQLMLPPYEFEVPDIPSQPTSRPAAIGAIGLEVELSELRLYRDVYYTNPPSPYGQWGLTEPYRLADDEYFVLGDNSPLSEDSRFWPGGPAVRSEMLIGKPLFVHLPSRLLWWGDNSFQIPDFAHIRYIR